MYGYNGLYDTPSCTNNGVGNAPEIISLAPFESSLVYPSTLLLPDVGFPGSNNEFQTVRGAVISPLKSGEVVPQHDNFNSIGNNYYNNSGVYDELSPNNPYNQRSSGHSSSFTNHQNGFLYHGTNYSPTSIQECNDRDIMNLLETGPVRNVFSNGDLQQINTTTPQSCRSDSSSSLHENINLISEGMKKVGRRYNAEERKERIERYRSKRNQRNFTKKIKYACRKTLADSRPRVRGRFMRNEDPEEPNEICFGSQTDHVHPEYWNNNNYQQIHGGNVEHGEEEDEVWTNLLESLSVSNNPYFC